MPTILGSGEHRYRVVENWAKLPDGWNLTDVASVAVDSKDRIYVFNRGAHPMVVLDREGHFITSWGEGLFSRAHGLHIDADDNLYCTDDGDHTVRKCSTDGKVLLTIGIPNKPAPFMSGEPFHRCTHTALSPKGEIYVSDGYGNACVHKYTPDGRLLKSWGEPGTDPGQFNIVHNIATDADGFVYVADRENHRVQVFDGNGKYETQWNNLHRPCALHCCGGKHPNFIVGELGPGMPVNRRVPNLGPRLTIVDSKGKRIARLGGEHGPGLATGQFLAPHGIALDSRGDIYVGEVGVTDWKTSFPDTPMPSSGSLPAEAGTLPHAARLTRVACGSWAKFASSWATHSIKPEIASAKATTATFNMAISFARIYVVWRRLPVRTRGDRRACPLRFVQTGRLAVRLRRPPRAAAVRIPPHSGASRGPR